MATLVLVRHGRTTANATGVLAGRTPGVELDETGTQQAGAAGRRLAGLALAEIVSSPLERCRQSATALLAQQPSAGAQRVLVEDDLSECDYGEWQGRALSELAQEPLWATVQTQPTAAVFPGGESMPAMQARGVAAVRRHDARITQASGPHAVWAAVSHGDVIKAILADALGMHLDSFQRLDVHPASISIVHYGGPRPAVLGVNTLEGELGWLGRTPGETVGGGAGAAR
ncbi:MSMEG_4193 family putative phosphomutase [Pseudactinotalea sp.]|uniref:MSMEG_4193 family putative phosphomutase n=1 Tax=Pseudactinotalea sp. TaxID=1926260 RepID=UPI003B3AA1C8